MIYKKMDRRVFSLNRLSGGLVKNKLRNIFLLTFVTSTFLLLHNSSIIRYQRFNAINNSHDGAMSPAKRAIVSMCSQLRSLEECKIQRKYKLVIEWLCDAMKEPISSNQNPSPRSQSCAGGVTYQPIGRLGNLMGLYAILYSFSRKYGVAGYVDPDMWNTLSDAFPHISLKSADAVEVEWTPVTYQEIESKLSCSEAITNITNEYYWITNYPDRNGIDIFHPYYDEIREEFRFSSDLQNDAQTYLHSVRGSRTNVTFIGFHIRRTDYREYIKKNYNISVPEEAYYLKCLDHYRSRFKNALFVVSSDDMDYVNKTFSSTSSDIVLAGNGALESPARDMAILAACNHSIVTVGTYGFWGAYLAGGTVLVPEAQSHIGRGDRGTPLLEIQLAGAENWIAIS